MTGFPKYPVKKARSFAKLNKIILIGLNFYFDTFVIQLCVAAVSVYSCVYYVMASFSDNLGEFWQLDILFFTVFLYDYIMCISAAHRKTDYIFSFVGISDLLSMLPLLGIFYPVAPGVLPSWPESWIGFLRFFRLSFLFQIAELNIWVKHGQIHDSAVAFQMSEITYQTSKLLLSIMVFLLVSTGSVFALLEHDANAFYHSFPRPMNWFDSLYFIVVTVTTVGYGDITPATIGAEALTMAIILVGFGVIPAQVSALFTALYSKPNYAGRLYLPPSSKHICVCGIVYYDFLYCLLTEIFHPTHAPAVIGASIIVVILSPIPPSRSVKMLLKLSQFRSRVKFFQGSSKSAIDLYRIKTEDALAIYVISDEFITPTSWIEEDDIFLSAISISRYLDLKMFKKCLEHQNKLERSKNYSRKIEMLNNWCCCRAPDAPKKGHQVLMPQSKLDEKAGSDQECAVHIQEAEKATPTNTARALDATHPIRPRTMVKLSMSRNRRVLLSNRIDVILSLQEFKYTLIAYGAIFPGFLSLFLNLNRSRTLTQHSRSKWRQPELFYAGARFCLHQMPTNTASECRESLQKMTFQQAVSSLYRKSNGLVFLVAVKYKDEVLINPAHQKVEKGTESDIDRKTGQKMKDREEYSWTLGDCEAIFVIAPSWETAWEIMSEETEEDDETADVDYLDTTKQMSNRLYGKSFSTLRALPSLLELNRSSNSLNAWPIVSPRPTPDSEFKKDFTLDEIYRNDLQEKKQTQYKRPAETVAGEKKASGAIKVHRLNSFITSIVQQSANTSKQNQRQEKKRGPRMEPWRLSKRLPLAAATLKNHVVLLISSIGQPDRLKANYLMLPIVIFVKAVRAQSGDQIVVMCERAEELIPLAEEIDEVNPGLLNGVFFFAGNARNPEHLILCGVETARVVTVIRPPIESELSMDNNDMSRAVIVDADRHTIIASLNLHFVLKFQHKARKECLSGLNHQFPYNNGDKSHVTFTVCEIVHESNIVFLTEQGHGKIDDERPFGDGGSNHDLNITTADFYDWPLLAAGCVLSHTLLDALMVQAVFNPDIISFWEALTDIGQRGKCGNSMFTSTDQSDDNRNHSVQKVPFHSSYQGINTSISNSASVEGEERIGKKEPVNNLSLHPHLKDLDRDRYGYASLWKNDEEKCLSHENDNIEKDVETKEGFADQRKNERDIDNNSSSDEENADIDDDSSSDENSFDPNKNLPTFGSRSGSSFDKVDIPDMFIGKSFGYLFQSFFENEGAIAIALHRSKKEFQQQKMNESNLQQKLDANISNLPYLITAPAMDTILLPADEIFIFRRSFL